MVSLRFLVRAALAALVICATGSSAAIEGWETIPSPDGQIEVYRDSYGVPHVYADTFRDMFFGQGYVCAQDRLWQAEMYRRDARGELSEVFGEDRFRHDERARQQSHTEAERLRTVEHLSPELRAALEGVADGINAYVESATASGSLPPQYAEHGLAPRRWTVTDSIAIAEMMARRFGSGGTEEAELSEIRRKLIDKHGEEAGRAVFDDLMPLNDNDAPTTMPKTYKTRYEKASVPGRTETPHSAADALNAYRESWSAELRTAREIGSFTGLGSNAWVVSPKRSETGNAMLLGAPMMGFGSPQIAYEVHLNGPASLTSDGRMNVIGMAFAGLPTVLIGHNETVAWTTTSGGGNVSDLYLEELNPNNANQYRYQGEWQSFERIPQEIRVKGKDGSFTTRRIDVLRSVHGPIVSMGNPEGYAVAAKHSYWQDEGYLVADAFLDFNRCSTPEGFLDACSRVQTSHNFFYADTSGNIAYAWAGRYPIRPEGADWRLPLRGTGEDEWVGMMPFSDQPQSVNPEQGYFGNWNNKPADDWQSWFGRVFWGHRIYKRLDENDSMSVQDVMDLAWETGTNDFLADYFHAYLMKAVGHPNLGGLPEAIEAGRVAREYDGVLGIGAAGERLYDTFVRTLIRVTFSDEMPSLFAKDSLDDETLLALASLLLRVLEPQVSFVKPSRDYFNGEPAQDILARALQQTLSKLGDDASKWGGEPRQIRLGDAGTAPWARRGTYMQVVEMTKPMATGRNVLPPGQSDDPSSPHYADQVSLFAEWQYKPTVLKREDLGR
ncbi:penicillin acylase family protein [Candidatus Poribacteria bacterium]|nr:penicillin acylase family protein [Candidatus Poribacteria bacterium]